MSNHAEAGYVRVASPSSLSEDAAGALLSTLRLGGVVPIQGTGVDAPVLVLFDSVGPDVVELVRRQSSGGRNRLLAVAMQSEGIACDDSWTLLDAGASDVIVWDRMPDPTGAIAARLRRWYDVERVVDSPMIRQNLVGRSRAWMSFLRRIVEVAFFSNTSILLTGESGTGKELVARLIHTLDARLPKAELVVVDCTTIVRELSGSEFFGHERGAFTNAVVARDGAFALADGGTLFLDEVGELPLELQAELLRAVQERAFKRVGSNEWRRVAFRLICATNRDLLAEEAMGNFRRDFYYRIAGWMGHLPPLRERIDDVVPLAEHFVAQMTPKGDPPPIDNDVRGFLLQREYPGNVRELSQLVARIVCRHVGPGPLTVGDIPEEERPRHAGSMQDWRDGSLEETLRRAVARGVGLKEIGRTATDIVISIVLDEEQGNLQRAARRLGITDRALQMRQAERRRSLSDDASVLSGSQTRRVVPLPPFA